MIRGLPVLDIVPVIDKALPRDAIAKATRAELIAMRAKLSAIGDGAVITYTNGKLDAVTPEVFETLAWDGHSSASARQRRRPGDRLFSGRFGPRGDGLSEGVCSATRGDQSRQRPPPRRFGARAGERRGANRAIGRSPATGGRDFSPVRVIASGGICARSRAGFGRRRGRLIVSYKKRR